VRGHHTTIDHPEHHHHILFGKIRCKKQMVTTNETGSQKNPRIITAGCL